MFYKYGKLIFSGGKSVIMVDYYWKDLIKDIWRLNVDKMENIKVFDCIK